MERLETSLDDLLEHMPNLPLSLKRSLLEDVARGLLYLHDRQPPVIHRDLTSRNVLLTSSLVAKITDMGNSRIVTMRPGQMARTLSKLPGTAVYMPPEAQDDGSRYGPSLDIFSFGHLALYTLTQDFPGNLLPPTYLNPENSREVKGRTELERRERYIDLLESRFSSLHPALVELVKQCLLDDPHERPRTEQLLTRLQGMRGQVEGGYGGAHPIKLDMVRVRLAKELKKKNRRIEELTQQQARYEVEAGELRRTTEETRLQLGVLEELQINKDAHIQRLQNDVAAKDAELDDFKRQLEVREGRIEELLAEVQAQDEVIVAKNDLIAIKDNLIVMKETELTAMQAQEPHKPLRFEWRQGPKMPNEMNFYVQSVVIHEKFYVGGGEASYGDNYFWVLEYDMTSKKWTKLPPFTLSFAVASVNDQLVLVGGRKKLGGDCTNVLGVWNASRKAWTRPYPDMPTKRQNCSALSWHGWLVVAGGTESVDILNPDSKQWFVGPLTPVPWSQMKTAVVEDFAYFMGGYDQTCIFGSKKVYQASLNALLNFVSSASHENDIEIWKEIPEHYLTNSTPLSIFESLLAIGGEDKDQKAVTAIHRYQPESEKWVKVGDLPSPRYNCASAVTKEGEIVVAGGQCVYGTLVFEMYFSHVALIL